MDDEPFESLNMVPFIDVMLVLLTIVLLTSSFIVSGRIPLNLPQASPTSSQETDQPRIIELDAKGTLYYDNRPVSLDQLRAALQTQDRATSMLLRADKTITLQQFIDVAELLRQLGFSKVAVQTKGGSL